MLEHCWVWTRHPNVHMEGDLFLTLTSLALSSMCAGLGLYYKQPRSQLQNLWSQVCFVCKQDILDCFGLLKREWNVEHLTLGVKDSIYIFNPDNLLPVLFPDLSWRWAGFHTFHNSHQWNLKLWLRKEKELVGKFLVLFFIPPKKIQSA